MTKLDFDASVIIPTYNRPGVLMKTLTALTGVAYPRDRWEAIVVDDGSPDPGMVEVEAWVTECQARVRYVRVRNGGPAKARNFGASLGRGRVLIFLDNDIEVRPNFIARVLETLTANPGCCVFGRITHPPELRQTPFGRFRDAHHEAFSESHPVDQVSVIDDGLTAANLAMVADDFRRLGGFNESFTAASGEDNELGMRARAAGIRVLYDPLVEGLHNDWADTLTSYCERSRIYSRADVLYWRLHGESCPRAFLVRENAPIDWRSDPARLIFKKGVKRIVSAPPTARIVRQLCRLVETVAPDTPLCHKAYNVAIGGSIFLGVREGFRHYPASVGSGEAAEPYRH